MDRESLALVLVGHIDHGKSTLIGRLLCDTGSLPDGKLEEIEAAARAEGREIELGFIMDHLREERERGVTIDTAQTFFTSPTRDYVIIDAPGHREFIKNMITGASQAEAAVLVCSVAEGVQEQTKRHAYVVKLLGLEQVMVAYNKMDLVGYNQQRFGQVKRDMDEFLARIGVEPSIEVPISARCGDNVASRSENMPWYDGPTIVDALDVFRKIPPPTEKPLRFPVQDVYEGCGDLPERVVVGRIESGVIECGQRLRFLPDDEVRTVLTIKQYGQEDLAQAEAGQCVGVLCDGGPLRRGQVACPEGQAATVTSRFRASVFWLSATPLQINGTGPSTPLGTGPSAALPSTPLGTGPSTALPSTPLGTGPSAALGTGRKDTLTFKCATQKQACRVAAIHERIDSGTLERLPTDAGRLEETEVGEVVIETSAPVVLESFYDVQELGRFVLVKGQQVVAGGIVTRTQD